MYLLRDSKIIFRGLSPLLLKLGGSSLSPLPPCPRGSYGHGRVYVSVLLNMKLFDHRHTKCHIAVLVNNVLYRCPTRRLYTCGVNEKCDNEEYGFVCRCKKDTRIENDVCICTYTSTYVTIRVTPTYSVTIESLSKQRFCQHGRQPEVRCVVIDDE